MADIPAILTSISTAIEIAKSLREADSAIEKAELRLKLSEVVNGLADAKLAIADLREENHTKSREIDELQAAIETKGQFARQRDAYYLLNEHGQPSGEAHCLRCWEQDHRCRQLSHKAGAMAFRVCPTCKTEYNAHRTETLG